MSDNFYSLKTQRSMDSFKNIIFVSLCFHAILYQLQVFLCVCAVVNIHSSLSVVQKTGSERMLTFRKLKRTCVFFPFLTYCLSYFSASSLCALKCSLSCSTGSLEARRITRTRVWWLEMKLSLAYFEKLSLYSFSMYLKMSFGHWLCN